MLTKKVTLDMKKLVLLFFVFALTLGCSKDDNSSPDPDNTSVNDSNDSTNDNNDDSPDDKPDDSPDDPVDSIVYNFTEVGNSGVSGEATFERNEDNSTTVLIELENATSEIHPASINFNSMGEGGDVAITLNSCECAVSTTIVATFDDGSPITFDELLDFNGHINIYESEVLNDVIIAQTNIGVNSN